MRIIIITMLLGGMLVACNNKQIRSGAVQEHDSLGHIGRVFYEEFEVICEVFDRELRIKTNDNTRIS